MPRFQYDQNLLMRFPNCVGGVIFAEGLTNTPSSTALQALFVAEQNAVKTHIGDTALSSIPSLAAWRLVFSAFGVSPTQYRCAAEALLRRLTKKGDIPSINTLVDIGNLISIRYALPVAVLDTRDIQGAITVRFATGSETFVETRQSHRLASPDSYKQSIRPTPRLQLSLPLRYVDSYPTSVWEMRAIVAHGATTVGQTNHTVLI
jgi:DNA/RNA-binding domain of Phe-tRNA-synthetase-like protein